MSLYLKYRPKSFETLKGNEDTVTILQNLLSKKECPHSFLLYGPTGCGKTTVARIISNTLNCTKDNFKEIDSAGFRGIDTIRELRNIAKYKGFENGNRVFLLDECHKLTNDAQNALLKILEDTPNHVYFILCTTDPQKLIKAVRNRCQQFEFKPLNETELKKLLRRIVRKENEQIEEEVYDYICDNSLGYPRNALQILEQVLNAPKSDRLNVAKKSEQEQSEVINLCRALINKSNWKQVSMILEGLKGKDAEEIRRIILGYCQSILLKGKNDKAARIIEEFWDPFYNIGFPGVVYACYSIINN